jgi:hypothetical protein
MPTNNKRLSVSPRVALTIRSSYTPDLSDGYWDKTSDVCSDLESHRNVSEASLTNAPQYDDCHTKIHAITASDTIKNETVEDLKDIIEEVSTSDHGVRFSDMVFQSYLVKSGTVYSANMLPSSIIYSEVRKCEQDIPLSSVQSGINDITYSGDECPIQHFTNVDVTCVPGDTPKVIITICPKDTRISISQCEGYSTMLETAIQKGTSKNNITLTRERYDWRAVHNAES